MAGIKDSGSRKLLQLPVELLDAILSFLDPYELIAFAVTSKLAYSFASPSNQILWRSAFLHLFDDPTQAWAELPPTARKANAAIEASWDWYIQLSVRCSALKTLSAKDEDWRRTHIGKSYDVLVNIIESSRNPTWNKHSASGSPFREPFRCESKSIETLTKFFFDNPRAEKMVGRYEQVVRSGPEELEDKRPPQLFPFRRPFTRSMATYADPISENASRFHVYYGLTPQIRLNVRAQAGHRRVVFDYTNVSEANDYGPFKSDGSGQVDWKVLEAIASLIGYTFENMATGHFEVPQGLSYSLPNIVGIDPDCPEDWAGVTRRWLGIYSFIDHTELYQLNAAFQQGLQPSLEHTHEAHGDVRTLELRLDKSLKCDPKLSTDLPVCHDLPVLYFSGRSRAVAAMPSITSVRGTASLLPDGRHVRWRFIVR